MAEEKDQKWEYRAKTIGSMFGSRDENIQDVLNEWGQAGWEAFNVYTPYGGGKVTIVPKRPLLQATRRPRTGP
jgi:hypothetical protein